MSNKQKAKSLKEAREKIYNFFTEKGFVFPDGSRNYLSGAIKQYAAIHNKILIEEIEKNKKKK